MMEGIPYEGISLRFHAQCTPINCPSDGVMLCRRRRRWFNITLLLDQRFAGQSLQFVARVLLRDLTLDVDMLDYCAVN